PALAADDEDHEILGLARVGHLSWRRRLDVHEAARAERANLPAGFPAGDPRVDEVELVLPVVEVMEALVAGRVDDRVDAERRHAGRLLDFSGGGAPPR